MKLEIITPEKKVYSETVDQVVLPTESGEVGILPGHIPLMTKLAPGELIVLSDGKRSSLAVDQGFAEVTGDLISVLTEAALDVAAIDQDALDQAQERAQAALEEARKEKRDPAEIEELENAARFAIAKQLVKRRH